MNITDNTLVNGVNIIILNARMQALENILWGYLNVELDEMHAGYSKEYRKMFLEFFLENLQKLQSELPASLVHNQVVKTAIDQTVSDTVRQIAEIQKG